MGIAQALTHIRPLAARDSDDSPDQRIATPLRQLPEDPRHDRFLRLFRVSCVISTVVILSLVGLSIAVFFTETVRLSAEQDAVRYARNLLENGRFQLSSSKQESNGHSPAGVSNVSLIDELFRRTLPTLPVSKVKLYSRNRQIIYSTDEAIVDKFDTGNEMLEQALRGRIVSEFQSKADARDLRDEHKFSIDVVETYVPVRNSSGEIVGAFEIYLKMSMYHERLNRLLVGSLGVLAVVLVAVFTLLARFMTQATKTIYSRTEQLEALRGLLPICSHCKRIRNDEDQWELLETYISSHSSSRFSHGICPECRELHYPGL